MIVPIVVQTHDDEIILQRLSGSNHSPLCIGRWGLKALTRHGIPKCVAVKLEDLWVAMGKVSRQLFKYFETGQPCNLVVNILHAGVQDFIVFADFNVMVRDEV